MSKKLCIEDAYKLAARMNKTQIIGMILLILAVSITMITGCSNTKNDCKTSEISLTNKDEVTKTNNGIEYTVKVIGFSVEGSKAEATISVNNITGTMINDGSPKTIGGLKIYLNSISVWNNGKDGFVTLQLEEEEQKCSRG